MREPQGADPEAPGLLQLLALLHLSDSALPIGALAHSFGVESMVAECGLGVPDLPGFFTEWLSSNGLVEAVFCLRAFTAADAATLASWNDQLSALKPAEESRLASLRLGRRFGALAGELLPTAVDDGAAVDRHLALAFGWAGARLFAGSRTMPAGRPVAAAYLHQSLFGAISACQRLLPLGQAAATRLLWSLKPKVVEVVTRAATLAAQHRDLDDLWTLQPMLEIASMRHPQLETRLFIS